MRRVLIAATLVGSALSARSARAGDAPAAGTLVVDAACVPGEVFVDEKSIGPGPARLETPSGPHRIRVAYSDGYDEKRLAFVNPGVELHVSAAPPESRCLAELRRGWHLGAGLGFNLVVATLVNHRGSSLYVVPAPRLDLAANYGVSKSLDFRTGLALTLGTHGADFAASTGMLFAIDVPLHLRFNLGTFYTWGVGANVSFMTDGLERKFAAGPWINLLGFRLGSRNQWELDVADFSVAVTTGPQAFLRWGLSLTYLFLPSPPTPALR